MQITQSENIVKCFSWFLMMLEIFVMYANIFVYKNVEMLSRVIYFKTVWKSCMKTTLIQYSRTGVSKTVNMPQTVHKTYSPILIFSCNKKRL